MVVRFSKKVRKRRGSKTHGWGFKKRHRGKGHRGGHGERSGSGKRGQQRKTYFTALHIKPIGGGGMDHLRNSVPVQAINISDVQAHLDKLATKSGDTYTVDLGKNGFDKLLGTGRVAFKMNIICKSCSKSARQKIEAAGGKVEINSKKA